MPQGPRSLESPREDKMKKKLSNTLILKIQCPDRVGIVAAVSEFIAQHKGWVTEANYHSDPVTGQFYMRSAIRADSLAISAEAFRLAFQSIAKAFEMTFELIDGQHKQRVVLFASKESHCLTDLLHRWSINELSCDMVAVISNHEVLADLCQFFNVPFHHIAIDPRQKKASFEAVEEQLERLSPDLIVLARYMQIFPSGLCERYSSRVINIHHSFLPSFAGAKPYHQAYDRGVKLIGATSHYVTEALDEGPIIEQDVIRVSHHHAISELARLGRDIERVVLARAVRHHLEHRVFVSGQRTIVFD